MHIRLTVFALGGLALAGGALWLLGSGAHSCSEAIREESFDAAGWIATHGPAAEDLARRLLAGEREVPVPPALVPFRPRRRGETVVFTVVLGGFEGRNQGMCFSPSGHPPPESITSSPREAPGFLWERVSEAWWFWAAEFL
jgi:hypothetical protein